jgi:hypothetical protein
MVRFLQQTNYNKSPPQMQTAQARKYEATKITKATEVTKGCV